MTPREMLRRYFSGNDYRCDDLMNALTSAGYRILGPGEWDKETGWQPIETAPKDGTEILGAWSYLYEGDTALTEGVEIISWYTGKIDGWLDKDGVAGEGVFHSWMPVPAPPAIRALAKEKQGWA